MENARNYQKISVNQKKNTVNLSRNMFNLSTHSHTLTYCLVYSIKQALIEAHLVPFDIC